MIKDSKQNIQKSLKSLNHIPNQLLIIIKSF